MVVSCAQSTVNFKYGMQVQNLFSFSEPSTFHNANDSQKTTLRSIAEEEFSLDHLATEDQELLGEALRYSGVEVHHSCVIDEFTNAKLAAFLVKRALDRNVRYHPTLGYKDLSASEDDELNQDSWNKLFSSVSEYPYPFSEAQVLSKVVPIDLSSIQLLERSDSTASYTGLPSRLMIASVAEDGIVEREDLKVDFIVNLEKKRVSSLKLYLPESVRVFRGISLRELSITYNFENDTVSNRNVLVSMDQTMKGRIWFTFRPNLSVTSTFSYVECEEEAVSQSYLFESIDAIRALGQDENVPTLD